jgi:hypothetical protein
LSISPRRRRGSPNIFTSSPCSPTASTTTKPIRLDWFKTPFAGQGIYEYYRRQHAAAEQRRKPEPAQTVSAIGSMEWAAEQEKARSTAAT